MSGRASSKFLQRSNFLTTFTSDNNTYYSSHGVDCMYCEKYFPNKQKPLSGGYICDNCNPFKGR